MTNETSEVVTGVELRSLLLMALATAFSTGACFGASFQNGSFENPFVGGSAVVLDCPGAVAGWTHANNCANGSELLTKSGAFGLSTLDGGQYITWGGNSFTGGTLEQTFDTVIGDTYTVNYLIAIQQNVGPGQSMKVEAFSGLTLLSSAASNDFLFSALTAGPALNFLATSTSTTLRFTDTTSLANSVPANWGLDTVVLTDSPGAGVPEPRALSFVGVGIGVLLVFNRRRSIV